MEPAHQVKTPMCLWYTRAGLFLTVCRGPLSACIRAWQDFVGILKLLLLRFVQEAPQKMKFNAQTGLIFLPPAADHLFRCSGRTKPPVPCQAP